PARDMESSYTAWGHSMVTDPWGFVIDQLDETEGILTVELDMTRVDTVRQQLPLLKHRRTDMYQTRQLPPSLQTHLDNPNRKKKGLFR
ncbi:MAG: hypothetical protein J6I95_09800, partial [Anaerotignum sp.]|nr:hypothetical protein [Anaerotignum sp.]